MLGIIGESQFPGAAGWGRIAGMWQQKEGLVQGEVIIAYEGLKAILSASPSVKDFKERLPLRKRECSGKKDCY